jgi:PKD domain-containing protein
MRQRFLPNGLLTTAVAALLLGSPWVSTAAADAAQVTVVTPGGSRQTLALDALGGGDVVSRAYALRSAEGESTVTVSGFSPSTILDAAGADPYGFSYLEVQRAAGGSVLLSRDQALDPGAFPEGPPVIYATGTGTAFLRPSSGPEDLNASDSFEAPQGLTIVLGKGQPLQVRARASAVRARPRQTVDFSAIVERAGAGEQLFYAWHFDDGHSASGANVSHSFAKRGSYDVIVGLTTPGDETGASAVVTVQVGAPLGGPDRKGGGANEDAGAPDHGAASSSGTASQPTQVRSHLCPRGGAICDRNEDSARRRPSTSPVDGKQVSGLLLSSDSESPARRPPAPAARTGKLDAQGSGASLPGAAAGLLITVGLFGAGALVEIHR